MQQRNASAPEFAPFASECIAALAQTSFDSIAKGYQCLWGRWSGCGPSFDTHQHLERHQKLLQQFLVHGHRTHLISGGGLVSHPMKFFTFGIFACTKRNCLILGGAGGGVPVGGVGCNNFR